MDNGRTTDQAYAALKDMVAICRAAETREEARLKVRERFPAQNLNMLDDLSSFRKLPGE